MGKPLKQIQVEERQMRYPTLQRVAHTLPRDPKYRATVRHAIGVLERSSGWSFSDKLQAINTLKEVWENLASSQKMNEILERSIPWTRNRGDLRPTRHPSSLIGKSRRISLTKPK